MLMLTLLTIIIRRLFITRINILIFLLGSILLYNGYCNNITITLLNNLWIISNKRGIIGICIFIIGSIILKLDKKIKGEKALIISISIIGMIGIITSKNWLLLIISLELLTYSTSILACIDKEWESTRSSGLKYFLIGAFSSGLIMLGITIIYSETGLLEIKNIVTNNNEITFINGWNLILAGMLFKIGAAPFHYWAPDVYDGVPTIITAWIAILPKLSLLIFLYFYLTNFNTLILYSCWFSLIFGSILGLIQYRIKRLLAYSSITHIGFLLLGVLELENFNNNLGYMTFYVLQYALTSLTIFIIIICYDVQTISQLKGKINFNILLAICFNFCLFSLAGLPPFIGFFAKIQILLLSISYQFWWIVFTAILASVIGCVQYLRIINILNFSFNTFKYEDSTHKCESRSFHPGNINSHIISFLSLFLLFA
jgi:NADH-ubiquinone oxidoreductase chain 2